MSEFNYKKYLKEGRLLKENPTTPQVDIEVQGEIYTIPTNPEERERIFGDAEFELDDLLEDLGFDLDGRSSAAIASDLTQKDFIDSYGNEDTRTFERVKSLGVQVDAVRGYLDDKINSALQNIKENIKFKLSPEQQDKVDSLRDELKSALDPDNEYYDGRDENDIRMDIRKIFGDTIANQIEDGEKEMHFPRDTGVPFPQRPDKLAQKEKSGGNKYRVTKSGKMNKQDVNRMKSQYKKR